MIDTVFTRITFHLPLVNSHPQHNGLCPPQIAATLLWRALEEASSGLEDQKPEELVNIRPRLSSSIADIFMVCHRRCIDPRAVRANEQPHRRDEGR